MKEKKRSPLLEGKDFKMTGRKIVTWDGRMVRTKDPILSSQHPLIFLMELRAVIAFPLLICALTSTHAYATNLKI